MGQRPRTFGNTAHIAYCQIISAAICWAENQRVIAAKGIDADYKVVALTEDSLNSMAQALGCVADAIDFDSYPEQ